MIEQCRPPEVTATQHQSHEYHHRHRVRMPSPSKSSLINRGIAKFAFVSAAVAWLGCSACAADTPSQSSALFKAAMDRVFADGRADIRVVFGYENYEGLKDPCDPGRAQHFMKYLTNRSFSPITLTPELAADLGVPADGENVRVFAGTTEDGRRMRVALIWSSLTTSTAKNLGSEYPRQLVWSKAALNFMRKANMESEVMIYVGHSRGGGGPDTFPPVTLNGPNAPIQAVDFPYYRRNRPGLVSLQSSFAKAETTPSFIVWTGCLSHDHFRGWLTSAVGGKPHPTCLVLSTRLTNHIPGAPDIKETDESVMAAVSMMETLIFRQSKQEFEKRLLDCEIPEKCDTLKPLWKVTTLPGKPSSDSAAELAGGQ